MQNFLRTYRRKTEITIEVVSELINQDGSLLSRYERGLVKPCLEIIFTYHLLFNAPIEKLFEKEMKETIKKISGNIDKTIADLKKQNQTKKVKANIVFLNSLKDLIEKRK